MARRAFTLIELLAVIAIIALLLGILLPSLSAARATGQMMKCLGGLHDTGIAVAAYLQSNDDRFPLSQAHGGFVPGTAWLDTLMPHTESKLMYRCPTDGGRNFDIADAGTRRVTSYGLNVFMGPNDLGYSPASGFAPFGYVVATRIKQPSRIIYVCELAEEDEHGTPIHADHVHPERWGTNVFQGLGGREPAWDIALARHLGKTNYVYVNAHAESVRFDTTWHVEPGNGYKTIDQWDPGFPHSAAGWLNPDDLGG